jgi:hypothetical protein
MQENNIVYYTEVAQSIQDLPAKEQYDIIQ